jgi:hypothetical protein
VFVNEEWPTSMNGNGPPRTVVLGGVTPFPG